MRYNVRYIYGRYEIQDSFNDHVVCYVYRSENAEEICRAMNIVYEEDMKKMENET